MYRGGTESATPAIDSFALRFVNLPTSGKRFTFVALIYFIRNTYYIYYVQFVSTSSNWLGFFILFYFIFSLWSCAHLYKKYMQNTFSR